jgi:hypothetical protein
MTRGYVLGSDPIRSGSESLQSIRNKVQLEHQHRYSERKCQAHKRQDDCQLNERIGQEHHLVQNTRDSNSRAKIAICTLDTSMPGGRFVLSCVEASDYFECRVSEMRSLIR